MLLGLSGNSPHSSTAAPLSCPRLPPPNSPLAPLCCPVSSCTLLVLLSTAVLRGSVPSFHINTATDNLSHFTDSSPLDFTSSFSSCPFFIFNDLPPLLSDTGYFGLPAGMSCLVGLSSEPLFVISAAITWPLHVSHFQAVRKTHVYTLCSLYLLPHVYFLVYLLSISFYFAADTFRFQFDPLKEVIFLRM